MTRRKPIGAVTAEHKGGDQLSRSISLFHLTMFGVGTEIFFALTETVPAAGPGVIVSFVIASVVAGLTQRVLDKARARIGDGVEADFVMRVASSAREGLVATADDVHADMIVVGSARGGAVGRFVEGSVATELLRSAPLPVILCPRGYHSPVNSQLSRLSVAFSGASGSAKNVEHAATLAAGSGVPIRIVSFVVRDKQMYPTGAGYDAENMVINQLKTQMIASHDGVLKQLDAQGEATSIIGDGPSWKDAMTSIGWRTGELLVVGASSLGPIARVFLGSNSGKVVHNSPVPCLLLPRNA